MLDIKTFKDGSRLVLVIDGLEEIEEKEVLGTLLKGLCSDVKTVDRVNAKPVEEPEKEYSFPEGVFTDGPYIGKRPESIITGTIDEQYAAFKFMGEAIKDNSIAPDLIEATKSVLNEFLKYSFSEIKDAKSYVEEMTLDEKMRFISTFSCALTDTQQKTIGNKIKVSDWNYSAWGQDTISNAIFLMVKRFILLSHLSAA